MRAILTYHSVDDSGSPISIAPDEFRAHAAWLASGAVRVLDVEELLSADPSSDSVAITFDDGFVNFATLAWPILREYDLPVTLFVVTGRTGADNRWEDSQPGIPTLPLLDWPEIGRLAGDGVSIASHTKTHRPLAGLERQAVEEELEESAERIEVELGVRPRGLAYPYGSVDGSAAEAASRSYKWACTTELRAVEPDERPFLLPRLDMYYFRGRGRLEQWGSVSFRQRLRIRAVARRLRRTLNVGRA